MSRYAHAVKVVLPFTSKEKTLTLLHALHVRAKDGHVLVEASDKWTVMQYRFVDESATDVDFVISVPSAKVALTEKKTDLTLSDLESGADVTGEYPPLGRFFPSEFGEAQEVHMNGEFLSRFKTSALAFTKEEKLLPLTMKFGTKKNGPVVITFSDHITALLMPVMVPKS